MIHIVIEESLGFGGGGWDVGHITRVIHQGKVIAKNRDGYIYHENNRFLVKVLKQLGHEYRIHRIDSTLHSNKGKCKKLIEKLKGETK